MNIKLLAKNIELTDELKDYVLKKMTKLGRLLNKFEKDGGEVKVNFEVAKSTQHHKHGKVFKADCVIVVDGKRYKLVSEELDIYKAIDAVKEGLWVEINRSNKRAKTLTTRGARSVKKMLKGLSKRNPQTSKY